MSVPRPPLWPVRRIGLVLGLLGAAGVLTGGCARQSAPPGGPPDNRPPVVIRTVPEALADVPDFRGPVRFEFDERISEQGGAGSLRDAVAVSPRTGEVRVSHGRRSLSVEIGGGFRPGVVYRVTLYPEVRDLFGNTLRDPFELVFSTGAEPEATAVVGEVWDRVTGQGVSGVTLHAVSDDSLVHVASSGDGGVYAFRYLPSGTYQVTAFQDQNRDRQVGPNETQGRFELALAAGDTTFVDVPIVAPDTSSAVLLGVDVMDSVTVALRFDDYVDPVSDLDALSVEIRAGADGEALGVEGAFHAADWVRYAAEVADSLQRADSVARAVDPVGPGADSALTQPPPSPAGDTLPPDTLAAAGPSVTPPGQAVRRGPPALPGGGIQGLESARARGRILPARRVVLVLDRPLEPGTEYTVTASGVVNVNGLGDGGGEVSVTRPANPEEGG